MKKQKVRTWLMIVMSYCTSLALCMNFRTPSINDSEKMNVISEILYNLIKSLKGTSILSGFVFIGLIMLNLAVNQRKSRRYVSFPVVSFLVALVWLMGESFRIDDSLSHICSSGGQIVKSVLYVTGITYLLTQILYLFDWFLAGKLDFHLSRSRIVEWYRRHTFTCSFVLLLICWMPQVLICYPGYMCADVWKQLTQYWGYDAFTSHHPPVHTLLVGLFTKIGMLAGNGNLGLYLFILMQVLLFAGVLSYLFCTMRQLSAPRWVQAICFAVAVLSPYYVSYACLITKDTIYSYAVVLFMIELVYLLVYGMEYFSRKRHVFLMALSILGVMLFRNNGKYMLYPTIALLLIMMMVKLKRKETGSGNVIKGVLVLILPVVAAGLISSAAVSYFHIEKGSIREALSLPFQQTARYVKEHGDEVTPEEKAAIAAVLDYDHLADNYDPRISDPVKSTFNDDADTEQLLDYLKVWFGQFCKHPVTYIAATMNQNYYLVYPGVENKKIYSGTTIKTSNNNVLQLVEKLGVDEGAIPAQLKNGMKQLNELLISLPVIGLFSHQAFYNLILIALILYAVHRKLYRFLILSLPVVLSDITIILAPVIQLSPRYAFPVIYSMPLLLVYYLYLLHSSKELPEPAAEKEIE